MNEYLDMPLQPHHGL